MKIKWNWGTKLLVAMILFMLLLMTFVFLSYQQEYNLVEKDYYPKALEYQEKIDKTSNAALLSEKVKVENKGEFIQLLFPAEFNPGDISGQIVFYRPSSKKEDVKFTIQANDDGIQVCRVDDMLKGKYILKIDYEVKGMGYYQEESVFVKMN